MTASTSPGIRTPGGLGLSGETVRQIVGDDGDVWSRESGTSSHDIHDVAPVVMGEAHRCELVRSVTPRARRLH